MTTLPLGRVGGRPLAQACSQEECVGANGVTAHSHLFHLTTTSVGCATRCPPVQCGREMACPAYSGAMSVLEQPGQRHFLVLEPEEGLRRVKPLPAEADLVIEDVTDEEWEAFHEAIAER